jgi:hypothetical protein
VSGGIGQYLHGTTDDHFVVQRHVRMPRAEVGQGLAGITPLRQQLRAGQEDRRGQPEPSPCLDLRPRLTAMFTEMQAGPSPMAPQRWFPTPTTCKQALAALIFRSTSSGGLIGPPGLQLSKLARPAKTLAGWQERAAAG